MVAEACAQDISYATEEQGREYYYLFVREDRTDMTATDPSTFQGARVGINKGIVRGLSQGIDHRSAQRGRHEDVRGQDPGKSTEEKRNTEIRKIHQNIPENGAFWWIFLHKNLKSKIFLFLNYDMLNMKVKEQRQEEKQLDTKWKDTEVQAVPIEPGNVLLVLSDACAYYFDSLFYLPKDSEDGKPLEYFGYSHIGIRQDSYLVMSGQDGLEDGRIDLRYFPGDQTVEFYMEETDGCPWYLENRGSTALKVRTSCGTICLKLGERKPVCRASTE